MASLLSPYLNFAGNAREVLEFYQSVFGGTVDVNTYGDFGAPDDEHATLLMHGQLDTDAGYTIMCADAHPSMGMDIQSGNHISLCLSGDDAERLRGYFARLAEGGTVTVPLEKQMWGDEFGQCVDRFGIGWMVDIDGSSTAEADPRTG
jgi:PhnB protein